MSQLHPEQSINPPKDTREHVAELQEQSRRYQAELSRIQNELERIRIQLAVKSPSSDERDAS